MGLFLLAANRHRKNQKNDTKAVRILLYDSAGFTVGPCATPPREEEEAAAVVHGDFYSGLFYDTNQQDAQT